MGSENPEPYDACPYCLSEMTAEESLPHIEAAPAEEVEAGKKIEETVVTAENKPTQTPTKGQCAHHFGYLSERRSKEKIPEECVVCEDLIKCMLKTITS